MAFQDAPSSRCSWTPRISSYYSAAVKQQVFAVLQWETIGFPFLRSPNSPEAQRHLALSLCDTFNLELDFIWDICQTVLKKDLEGLYLVSLEFLELHMKSRLANCRLLPSREGFYGTGPQTSLVEAGGDAETLESPSAEEENDDSVAGMA